MEITKEDFSKEFLARFGDKEKQYILDFCNTFQKTFPNVLDKKSIIERISRISGIKENGHDDRMGYSLSANDTGKTIYRDMTIIYLPGQQERNERNSIYHELNHIISFKGKTGPVGTQEIGLWMEGFIFTDEKSDDFYEENEAFDEIMNELYTIKMLETEGRYQKKELVRQSPTMLDMRKISTSYKGNGYIDRAYLAEIYDEVFGEELLKAKYLERKSFEERFNRDFNNLEIKVSNTDSMPQFSKIGIQISENIEDAEQTAISIWKQKTKEKVKNGTFNLYDYLKSSQTIKKALPNIDANNLSMRGKINTQTLPQWEEEIQRADEEIIMKQLRPDLVEKQKNPEKIIRKKQFLGVINTLRDNIESLKREDIDKVTYGEMSQYNHSNLSCLVISAGSKEFMTFASEDFYMGSSEFVELPEEQTQEIFGKYRNAKCATLATPRSIWSIVKDNKGYIPLTNNPSMEYAELTDVINLDGTPVERDKYSKKQITSQQFKESLETSRKQSNNQHTHSSDLEKEKKQLQSKRFMESLKPTRKRERTGTKEVNEARDKVALTKERRTLISKAFLGTLDEDEKRRLEELNRMLNIKNRNIQQYEQERNKGHFTGQTR